MADLLLLLTLLRGYVRVHKGRSRLQDHSHQCMRCHRSCYLHGRCIRCQPKIPFVPSFFLTVDGMRVFNNNTPRASCDPKSTQHTSQFPEDKLSVILQSFWFICVERRSEFVRVLVSFCKTPEPYLQHGLLKCTFFPTLALAFDSHITNNLKTLVDVVSRTQHGIF